MAPPWTRRTRPLLPGIPGRARAGGFTHRELFTDLGQADALVADDDSQD